MAKNLSRNGRAKANPAVKIATKAAFGADGKPKPAVENALLRALDVQRPLVLANLRRLRRRNPGATTAELSAKLERDFLAGVTGGGAAIGATAILPGLGTVASLSLSAAATVGFLEATALYAQSVAELHGVQMQDPERTRTLVMAIMLGEEGTSLIQGLSSHALGKSGAPVQAWGSAVGRSMPETAVRSVGNRIRRMFLRKLLVRQGTAWVGRAIPFGIGAVVGGAGNLAMGRAVIAATRQAFGPAPMQLPPDLARELDK
jgi:hypothetical protein